MKKYVLYVVLILPSPSVIESVLDLELAENQKGNSQSLSFAL